MRRPERAWSPPHPSPSGLALEHCLLTAARALTGPSCRGFAGLPAVSICRGCGGPGAVLGLWGTLRENVSLPLWSQLGRETPGSIQAARTTVQGSPMQCY